MSKRKTHYCSYPSCESEADRSCGDCHEPICSRHEDHCNLSRLDEDTSQNDLSYDNLKAAFNVALDALEDIPAQQRVGWLEKIKAAMEGYA